MNPLIVSSRAKKRRRDASGDGRQAERGHEAKRRPAATLDASDRTVANDGIGRTPGPAYMRSFSPEEIIKAVVGAGEHPEDEDDEEPIGSLGQARTWAFPTLMALASVLRNPLSTHPQEHFMRKPGAFLSDQASL